MKNNCKSIRNGRLARLMKRLLGEQKGAVAMEYIVITLLVATAIFALVLVFGGNLRNMLGTTNSTMSKTSTGEVKDVAEKFDAQRSTNEGENQTAKQAGNTIGGDFGGE